ncbi:MAG: SUMF1/EgtB/PvdO family nonheme iron enzyme [Chloroflexota bacterium]
MTTLKRIVNELVLIEGGNFLMGNPLSDNDILRLRESYQKKAGSLATTQAETWPYKIDLSLPTVYVDSFWISRYPIMQQEWVRVMTKNPSAFSDPIRPVECVTWLQAIEFCNQRSYDEGLTPCYKMTKGQISCHFQANGYRLPTEAEWAYAARGGRARTNFVFPGGNDVDAVAWHRLNSGKQTHPVGRKQSNELGLYDLAGNVYELCWDWHKPHYLPETGTVNPRGPDQPARMHKRVVRGGCYLNQPHLLYTGRRLGRTMDEWNDHLGFRVVRSAVQ